MLSGKFGECTRMGFMKEFAEFLREYKIIALAIAFIIGVALTNLVQSLVDNIIMPVVGAFMPGGNWQTATAIIGPVIIKWGAFLSAFINFVIIALVVFLIAKKMLKEEKAEKK